MKQPIHAYLIWSGLINTDWISNSTFEVWNQKAWNELWLNEEWSQNEMESNNAREEWGAKLWAPIKLSMDWVNAAAAAALANN